MAEKDAKRCKKAIEKELAKAQKAGKSQNLGSPPRGGAGVSRLAEERLLGSPNEPSLLQPVCYSTWSPDGTRELFSTIQIESVDRSEVFSATTPSMSVAGSEKQISLSRTVSGATCI